MLLKLYPRVHRRYSSLPVLGTIAEGFGTWLLNQGYSTDCVREHFCAMRRVARLLHKRGIGSVTELTRAKLQACSPANRLDDRRLTASVCLLDRYFESETSLYLTRFGVRYILKKHCARAQAVRPALANKRLHPHSMRHSTAVHLLRAGVDILTISQWLGHASVTTTNRYATTDLEMKRKAIEQAQAIDHTTDNGAALWRTDASILTWLEAL